MYEDLLTEETVQAKLDKLDSKIKKLQDTRKAVAKRLKEVKSEDASKAKKVKDASWTAGSKQAKAKKAADVAAFQKGKKEKADKVKTDSASAQKYLKKQDKKRDTAGGDIWKQKVRAKLK